MGDRPIQRVMIQCPHSSKSIFTGRFASAAEFGTVLAGKNAVGCSECGELHFWTASNAWLEISQDTQAMTAVGNHSGG